MPAIEKSMLDFYREGLFTRALGRLADCNPYPADSDEAAYWLDGWGLIDELNEDSSPKGDHFDDE
jgi:hypothetical protein